MENSTQLTRNQAPGRPGRETPSPCSFRQELLDHLDQVIRNEISAVSAMGPEFGPAVTTLSGLQSRLSEGRFHLAVLGQFKRGKSTLLNALLGEEILPSSVIPLTAIPTFIRFGEEREIFVVYKDEKTPETFFPRDAAAMNRTLLEYVSEAKNPRNQKGVLQVEVSHPSPILSQGVVLIDTPGIGSTHVHNTEMTLQFLPQCDAALFLVSADPPITEVEVAFLHEVKTRVPRLFFVLNKVDYLDDAEQADAIGFFRNVLRERISDSGEPQIFPVSAKMALQGRQKGDPSLWERSGLADITDHLIMFLAHDKNRVLREAIARRIYGLLHDVRLRVRLELKTLELPIDDLERRIQQFSEAIRQAETQRTHARDILAGDRKRVVAHLEERAEALRIASRTHLSHVAMTAMTSLSGESGEQAARDALAVAIPGFFEHELRVATEEIDHEISAVLRDHEKAADSLIESVRMAAATVFEIPYHAPAGEHAYALTRRPYWIERNWEASISPIPQELLDHALPQKMREKRRQQRVGRAIEDMVIRNVENLRWWTLQSIDATFRRFGNELDENMEKTIEATRGAIQATYIRRKEHAGEIAALKAHLEQVAGGLDVVLRSFCDGK